MPSQRSCAISSEVCKGAPIFARCVEGHFTRYPDTEGEIVELYPKLEVFEKIHLGRILFKTQIAEPAIAYRGKISTGEFLSV